MATAARTRSERSDSQLPTTRRHETAHNNNGTRTICQRRADHALCRSEPPAHILYFPPGLLVRLFGQPRFTPGGAPLCDRNGGSSNALSRPFEATLSALYEPSETSNTRINSEVHEVQRNVTTHNCQQGSA